MKKIFLVVLLLASSMFAASTYDYTYARVTHSKPVYEDVRVHRKHRHNSSCYEEYRVYHQRSNHSNRYRSDYTDRNSIGLDTIIGLASGVVIGNQIGKGNGRIAAKIVGGLIGANVANSMRDYKQTNHHNNNNDGYYETKRRMICNNRSSRVHFKKELIGYDNYFVYKGKEYVKFAKNTKRRIKVRTTIDF